MTDEPVNLDEHRNRTAQKTAEIRRKRLLIVQADRESSRSRQEILEKHLEAGSAKTWQEATATASYLINLFASTPEGADPRYQMLITRVLGDLARLSIGIDAEMNTGADPDTDTDPGIGGPS